MKQLIHHDTHIPRKLKVRKTYATNANQRLHSETATVANHLWRPNREPLVAERKTTLADKHNNTEKNCAP